MNAPAFALELDRFLQDRGVRFFRAAEICPVGKVTRHRETGAEVRLQAPPRTAWSNIVPTLLVLDWLRLQVGPLVVNSGYRDRRYNDAIGGEEASLHMAFNAIDFRSRLLRPEELARRLLEHPQAKHLGIGLYADFVHVDTRGLIRRAAPARWGTPERWWS